MGVRLAVFGANLVVTVQTAEPRLGLLPFPQPVRRVRRQVLLPEARAARAVGEAMEVERPIGEVRQEDRPDPPEIGDEVAFGDRFLVGVRRGGEKDLVEVRELQLTATDVPDAFLAEPLEDGKLILGRRPRAAIGGGRPLGRLRWGGRLLRSRGFRRLASS